MVFIDTGAIIRVIDGIMEKTLQHPASNYPQQVKKGDKR